LLLKTIVNRLDKMRRTFFRQGGAPKRNIIWSNGLKYARTKKRWFGNQGY
jgi:hypothetical protein